MHLPAYHQGQLEKAGHIYKGSHSGWYAVSDECFYTEAQIGDVVDPVSGESKKVSRDLLLIFRLG